MLQFSAMLELVAKDLNEYAREIRKARGDPKKVNWRWSTYALEAQAAVYDKMKEDGYIMTL